MKIMIELKNEPKKGDIIYFNGTEFECVSKNLLLVDIRKAIMYITDELNELNEKFAELKLHTDYNISALKTAVNEKLKTYHNILQTLTQGE